MSKLPLLVSCPGLNVNDVRELRNIIVVAALAVDAAAANEDGLAKPDAAAIAGVLWGAVELTRKAWPEGVDPDA